MVLCVAHELGEGRPITGDRRPNDVFPVVHGPGSYETSPVADQTSPDRGPENARGARKDARKGRKGSVGNQTGLPGDCCGMECSKARESLSAVLDGEPTTTPRGELISHLRTCMACRRFLDRARALDALTYAAQTDAPDVSTEVLQAARAQRHRPDPWISALRLGLVAVAVAQLALAVPGLIYGSDEGAPIHIAHEVGSWDLALAVGFLFAAWRPLRAVGMLPFAAALSAALMLTAVVDIVHGRAIALTETAHLLELVGTALLYLLMAPRTRSRPTLRVVSPGYPRAS
ncbi:MAG: hypothetical protein QOE62_3721 [Actinomycetota bacterium]|nr:hypothetical protein [Actinomycetota bacterium]